LSKDGDELFIHGDSAGLRFLAAKLTRLSEKADIGQAGHEHLMADEWSGNELGSKVQGNGTRLLNQVKIHGRPKAGPGN
jgi:hypothetical protein